MTDPSVIEEDLGTTVLDVSQKVREMILSGNAQAAVEWASALRDTTGAWREAREVVEVDEG